MYTMKGLIKKEITISFDDRPYLSVNEVTLDEVIDGMDLILKYLDTVTHLSREEIITMLYIRNQK